MLLKKKRREEKKGDGEKKVFYVQYFLSSLLPGCVFFIFSPFSFWFFLIFLGTKDEKNGRKRHPLPDDFNL